VTPSFAALPVLAAVLLLTACSRPPAVETGQLDETATSDRASITVSDRALGDQTLTIDEVRSPVDGFVVIHEMIDGKPVAERSLGYVPVHKGKNGLQTILLTTKPEPGATLIAMLHGDDGQVGVYEFGPTATGTDRPVMVDGKPVGATFKAM
jgi:hypothetical protein